MTRNSSYQTSSQWSGGRDAWDAGVKWLRGRKVRFEIYNKDPDMIRDRETGMVYILSRSAISTGGMDPDEVVTWLVEGQE